MDKVSFTFSVDSAIVHNALNPKRFGAIFTFEGWHHEFRKRRISVDFLLVCPQLKPHLGCTTEMVYVHNLTPAIELADFPTFEAEFKRYIIEEWNH